MVLKPHFSDKTTLAAENKINKHKPHYLILPEEMR